MCGGAALPGAVACRDCTEYSFEAVGWPIGEAVMVGDNRGDVLADYKDTINMAGQRMAMQDMRIRELEDEVASLKTEQAHRLDVKNTMIGWAAFAFMFCFVWFLFMFNVYWRSK
jgi:hypothetical protein